MAGEDRSFSAGMTFEELLASLRTEGRHRIDPWQLFRRLEVIFSDRPRLGESRLPSEDAFRLGQSPSPAFEPTAIVGVEQSKSGTIRILLAFFGLFGPFGPLPLHLTEYARERIRHRGDATFSRFADVFHHRLASLFFRAYANAEPTVERDRREKDRFRLYVGSLVGMATGGLGRRAAVPDDILLQFAGRLSPLARNADGLAAVVEAYFGVRTRIQEYIGEWIVVPDDEQWKLGTTGPRAMLGRASLGKRVWLPQGKFRIVMGPLGHDAFRNLLPGSEGLKRLQALVRSYVGDVLDWELALLPDVSASQPMQLGAGWLGWTSWLGTAAGKAPVVVVQPPPPDADSGADDDQPPVAPFRPLSEAMSSPTNSTRVVAPNA